MHASIKVQVMCRIIYVYHEVGCMKWIQSRQTWIGPYHWHYSYSVLQLRGVLPLNHFSHLRRFLPAVVVAPRLTVTATSRISIVNALFVLYTL